ncbi:MAG: hypothetical protein QOH21_2256 [Acidobacteriota bacterium]|jgi:hypothetical protein|nr:hypothetical protein [Acidobacteriota bacterium]
MTEVTLQVTLQPGPRWREVVLEQVRIVGLSLRTAALVAAVVLGVGTFIVAIDLLRGGPGFDSDSTFPTALFSFLFPFAVWRSDKPFGPAFLWTLPVDRRRLALAKVFAGWVWLMVALAGFVAWLFALVLLAHASPVQHLMRVPFTATIATYLFGSALVVGLRHPQRWLLGAGGLFLLLGGLSEVFGSGFIPAVNDAAAVWGSLPGGAQWAIATFLGLGAGLTALWAAVARHKENR